jgi:hypothetical protein
LRTKAAVLVSCLFVISGFAVLPATAFAPAFLASGPIVKASTTSSLNWAGYVVTGASGSITTASGSWVQPAVTCPSSGNTYAAFWVGIDGYSDSTVEQTGTLAECQSGTATYFAWYEFYPRPSFEITTISVHAGDVMSASVQYTSGKFVVTITDVTTGQTFSTSAKVNAQRTSAEWIAEAPSSGGSILPLADFGTASFGSDYTGVASTNYATISGTTGAIGSFGTSVVAITMVDSSGGVKASSSSLSSDGTSFTVTWYSST